MLAPPPVGAVGGVGGVRDDEDAVARHLQVELQGIRALRHRLPAQHASSCWVIVVNCSMLHVSHCADGQDCGWPRILAA